MSRGHNRPLKHKGPIFESFLHQQRPEGKRQWISHQGVRQQKKNLRRLCVKLLSLKDEASVLARERCKKAVETEPDPEFSALHLMAAAWDAHEGTGTPWEQAMNYLLDRFDEGKQDALEAHHDVSV